MSVRVDTSSLIAGACVVGNRGLGVTGAIIRATTATGAHGPGYLYNDWEPGDDAKEFRGLIVTPPGAGTFAAFEDGSFSLTGAADGTYSFVYRLYVDGADLGTATASIVIGTVGPDVVAPTLAGSLTATSITATSYTLTWSAGSDNVAVTSYELSLDGGATWADVGAVLTTGVTGRTPESIDSCRVRAKDAAGNVSSPAIEAEVTLLAVSVLPTIVTGQFRDRATRALLPSTLIPWVRVTDPITATVVLVLPDQTTALDSTLTIADAALTPGKTYVVDAFDLTAANTGSRGEVAH